MSQLLNWLIISTPLLRLSNIMHIWKDVILGGIENSCNLCVRLADLQVLNFTVFIIHTLRFSFMECTVSFTKIIYTTTSTTTKFIDHWLGKRLVFFLSVCTVRRFCCLTSINKSYFNTFLRKAFAFLKVPNNFSDTSLCRISQGDMNFNIVF